MIKEAGDSDSLGDRGGKRVIMTFRIGISGKQMLRHQDSLI
jgi:hypothetical protein